MLKILWLLWLPMEVSAYTLSQTFQFKNIPMEIGARHIHSPEHLETAFSLTLPRFKVTETFPPQQVDNKKASIIAFKYQSIFHSERSARLFSDNRFSSNLFLFDEDERAYCMANFHITPLGIHGHSIRLNIQFFQPITFIEKLFAPIYLDAHSLETGLNWNYRALREDHNLREYRRAVLFGVFKPK